jgi:hypothetical protein
MDLNIEVVPDGDPATKAFIEMRNAVAGMTMAVNKMAGEWNALEIPDYTETLGKMADAGRPRQTDRGGGCGGAES